jgi:CRP-like cAMP-binding protein
MADKLKRIDNTNQILSHLSPADFGLLSPHLTQVDLPHRKGLEARNRPIEHAYFIQGGFASVVTSGQKLQNIEVGMIGQEGMTGLALLLGSDRSPHETYMQSAGTGWRISASHLHAAMDESASLRRALLKSAYAFLIQTSFTVLSNGRGKLEERLARWLLMAHDRSSGDELLLTHDLLALMLGVRRPGVTIALSLLHAKGLIEPRRGAIWINDREGLKVAANGAYGASEAEIKRLFS